MISLEDAHRHINTAWQMLKTFSVTPAVSRDNDFWQAFADALETPDIKAACETQFGRDLIVAVERELRNE